MGKVVHECLVYVAKEESADCDLIYEFKKNGALRYQGYALRYEGDESWVYYISEVGTAEDMTSWKEYAAEKPRSLSDFVPDEWEHVDEPFALTEWPKPVLKHLEERKILLRMML